jgi:hypothetical protein
MKRYLFAIDVDEAWAYEHSEFARDMRAEGHDMAATLDGDISVLLMGDDIIAKDHQVQRLDDIVHLVAETANELRDVREGYRKGRLEDYDLQDFIDKVELNLEKVLDRIAIVTYGEETKDA